MHSQENPARVNFQEHGFASAILILLAALGVVIFILFSSTFPFKDKLFSYLYPKSPSEATESLVDIPAPANLTAIPISFSQINLSWSLADNNTTAGYEIYRNNTKIATIAPINSFGDTNLDTSTTYTYFVRAFDSSGNLSAPSNSISASTLSHDAATGNISGLITTEGNPVGGVRVALRINNATQTYLTNSKGVFTITNIPPGTYVLSYEKRGFRPLNNEITIENGKTIEINRSLNKI